MSAEPVEELTDELMLLHELVKKYETALAELWRELSFMDGDKPHRLCGICKAALEPKP
jgi:hypothetical protein